MPVRPTYPGVYIEEIPSGVRTIVGVATSIAAFLGRAPLGVVDEPVTVTSFAAFERLFGGLDADYPMTYAVRDFFDNGGSTAVVVRVFRDSVREAALAVASAARKAADVNGASTDDVKNAAVDAAKAFGSAPEKTAADKVVAAVNAANQPGASADALATAAEKAVEGDTDPAAPPPKSWTTLESEDGKTTLALEALSPGAWGNKLEAKVDYDGIGPDVPARYGLNLGEDQFFNLTIALDPPNGPSERILNLSINPQAGSRDAGRVLQQTSQLARVRSLTPPADASTPISRPAAEKCLKPDPNDATKCLEPKQPVVCSFAGGRDSAPLDRTLDGDGTSFIGSESGLTGLYALKKADLFNLLCIPADGRGADVPSAVYQKAVDLCVDRRAVLIVDSPFAWGANPASAADNATKGLADLGITGIKARNAVLYFPRVLQGDPLREGQIDTFVPCGIMAGVMARTDTQRGVWKAPAGVDATLDGIRGLQVNLGDEDNGLLNPLGINCLRTFPVFGTVAWGARTLRGADQLADEYKYLPVRRLALFLEESLFRGLKWVVFEPNDEPLWAQIRLNAGAFMQDLFRQGAFQGRSPREAYFVKCDKDTTTQNDINLGIVNIVVGFAPLKPAEFVIVKIQQMAGQIAV